jgi:hypothetical protein
MPSPNDKMKAPSSPVRYVFSPDVFKRNCLLAIIVGCLLTIANQLDVLLSQPFTLRLGGKILFNFLIPFVVSSVSAAVNSGPNV